MLRRSCVWVVGGLVAMPVTAWGQDRFADVEIKTIPVAGPVYMLQGSGGNIGVSVGDDGVLMVDDQFAPLAKKIRAALNELGAGKLKFVLNTHWHGDHTGGNPEFGPEAPIIAHQNVRKRLATRQEIRGRVIEPIAAEGLPVITFDDSLTIHFNGEEIRMIHLARGHTDGDSIVLFTGSNVAHLGDHFFAGRFPFVDLASGGDVEGLTANIKKVIGELAPDVKIIPGHGPLSNLDDLKAYYDMLVDTTNIVRERIKAGKNLEAIQKDGLPQKWEEWGTGFISIDFWLETIFKSLTRK